VLEQNEIEVLVGEAENRVERLRSLYDQYFMGIERIEPQIARKDVERRIQILRRTQIRNTALRFRFQNVLLRYNTFAAHWMRICRQIEDGTYKHHLRKAKERFDPHAAAREARAERKRLGALEFGDTEPPGPDSVNFEGNDDLDVDVDFEEGPDVRAALRPQPLPKEVARAGAPPPATTPAVATTGKPPPPPLPPGRKPPPPPPVGAQGTAPRPPGPPPVPGAKAPPVVARPAPAAAAPPAVAKPADPSAVSDERVRQIYSRYVESRRSLGESTASITMDSMAKSLRDSSAKLREKHVGKNVDFEVQVKDGKTVLKPIVR